MTRLPSLILSTTLLTVLPSSQPEVQTCAVQVVIDLQTYDGPKHYENFCLSQPAMYGDGLLSIEAVSLGDGIFRDGFDTPPVATGAEQ
jgi:hypothetical protein